MKKNEESLEEKKKPTEITLRSRSNHNGSANHVRTFSKNEHGEDFMDLANEWKEKYNAIEV